MNDKNRMTHLLFMNKDQMMGTMAIQKMTKTKKEEKE